MGKERPSARRRIAFWLGITMVAGGVGLLGYVGWEMFGTNWVSEKKHDDGVADVRQSWMSGDDQARTEWGNATAIVEIPRFGDDYEVPVLEGISDDALAAGYGTFENAAKPGGKGNFSLAGHRVTHGEPLRDMPKLEPGDEVRVLTRKATYVYELTTGGDDLTVPFTAGWVLDPVPTNPDGGVQPEQKPGQRLITLTTCSELFHTDGRLIAFGRLVDTLPASA